MPKLKITKAAIREARAGMRIGPDTPPLFLWDSILPGFGVAISGRTGRASYVAQREVKGKSKRVAIGPVDLFDLDKAREEARTRLGEIYQGIDRKKEEAEARRERLTLREGLDHYLKNNRGLREKTKIDFRAAIEKNLEGWLDRSMREITRDEVAVRHREIQEEVLARANGREGVDGTRTANMSMKYLRAVWYYNQENGGLGDCPVALLTRQKSWFAERRRTGHVPEGKLKDFYKAIMGLESKVQGDFLRVVLFTGLRRGEAAALTWEEIDLKAKILRLPPERTKAVRKLELPLSNFMVGLLKARLRIGKELKNPYIFPSDAYIRERHIQEGGRFALGLIEKKTGIRASLHDLRRTFITVAEGCDIPVFALKALANHSLGSDITASYVVPNPERLREPLEKVTAKLMRLCGIRSRIKEK